MADIALATDARLTGGRQSDFALLKRGDGSLILGAGAGYPTNYRFSGGTRVEAGELHVYQGIVLISNTNIQAQGLLRLGGKVVGDVINDGQLSVEGYDVDAAIEGNYRQSAAGSLLVYLGGPAAHGLQISGRADIEGGSLELLKYTDAWGPYPLPTAPFTQQILHADGGVFGEFSAWTSPGLFITGSLRYLSNDIFFDASSISAQAVLSAARVGDALTLSSAGNFDSALNAFTAPPDTAPTEAQRQFLRSAALIQRLGDYDQAVTTFDSLSGHGQFAAVDALLHQALASASQAGAHAGGLQPGAPADRWAAQVTMVPGAVGAFSNTQVAGFDQWLGDGLVFGGSFGWTQANLQVGRSGGTGYSQAPQWNFYLRRDGSADSYLIGDAGYSRQQLSLNRTIDLGARRLPARSERKLDVSHVYLESGRQVRVGRGLLTPFAALGYAALRSDAFTEQGSSGFELTAQASFHQRFSGEVGLRYERSWRWGGDRWLRLDLGSRFQHLLGASDDMRAAFTGTPTAGFQLGGLPRESDANWLEANLVGGAGDRWSWLLNYDNRAGDETVSLGFQLQR